ncbi:MAG: putative 2,3-bisphosphoglycerate-independent phosphoglycerate mutase [Promethearchaeota archaeon]|nr:MAG: putative 2,3-bisphosphoglycerate-independent phosphoglycerate mutase [Candidatus Lokiarchaeota archaeon]
MSDLHLKEMDKFKGRGGPLAFIILDGVGIGPESDDNAFYRAKTPFLDELITNCKDKCLFTELKAHGTAVGLPSDEEMGNSEVGHNAMGAGRIVKQRATLAKDSILSGNLFETEKWKNLTTRIIENEKTLHFMGLLSDGYVHSHITHLFGLLDGAAISKVGKIRVHTLLDGRDVPPQSALTYIDQLEQKLDMINGTHGFDYKIASGGGRMRVTMDRYYSDWDVVRRGWEAHVCGIPEQHSDYHGYFKSAKEAIKSARARDPEISDQYLPSFVIVNDGEEPIGKMNDGDVMINFNFRGDRAVEISQAFETENYGFEKKCDPMVKYYGLLQYDKKMDLPHNYFIEPPEVDDPITKYLCAEKVSQYAIAETHKYGHITYFWNGNKEGYVCEDYEKYVEIQSDPSEMIEENPEMKAEEVKNRFLDVLSTSNYKFMRVNFANGDMVGHTGNINAAIVSAEKVDQCVKEIVSKVLEHEGIAIVTADHGNLEEMGEGQETAHSLNPVMFNIVDSGYNNEYIINEDIEEPGLGNIGATILNLLGFEKPDTFMDSLISFNK